MQYLGRYTSPLGAITLGSDGESLIGLWFDGEKFFCDKITEDTEEGNLPVFDTTRRWLDVYFSGRAPDFTPPLKAIGSDFQLAVWQILRTIPFGRAGSQGSGDWPTYPPRPWGVPWDTTPSPSSCPAIELWGRTEA